jgi:hypothetical protein
MKSRDIQGTAKRLCLLLPAACAFPAGIARADACEDTLVQQVFVHHAADSTPDSKMALKAWLCEGASDAFLSQQTALPAGAADLAAWNTLLGAIDGDTDISTTPVGTADVGLFRANNCPDPAAGHLIHALGRVATTAEFEAWHGCDAAATALANGGAKTFDLDLSCAGQQTATGNLVLSVRGFDSTQASATTPLRNFVIGRTNLTQVSASTEILSGQSGTFEFSVDDATLESSVTLHGTANSPFGEVPYYCNLDTESRTLVFSPYVVPPEAECAFDANRPGTTSCPGGGTLEQMCEDGAWVDSTVCVIPPPPAWTDNNWQIQFPEPLTFSEETSAGNTFWASTNRLTVPGSTPPVVMDVFMEDRPCSQLPKLTDARGRDYTTSAGQPLRALAINGARSSSAYFFIHRPDDATKCLMLQVIPNVKVTIDLDAQSGIGKSLLDIGKSMKSLSTRLRPSPRVPTLPPRRF